MKYLTDTDFTEIREVFNDVQETFYGTDLTYKMDSNTATRWMKDIEGSRQYTDKSLKCLVVWENTSSQEGSVNAVKKQLGAVDMTKGYILVRYDDCVTQGLVDGDKKFLTNTPQDKVIVDTIEYPIDGINMLGQWNDTNVIVKIHIHKEMRKD